MKDGESIIVVLKVTPPAAVTDLDETMERAFLVEFKAAMEDLRQQFRDGNI